MCMMQVVLHMYKRLCHGDDVREQVYHSLRPTLIAIGVPNQLGGTSTLLFVLGEHTDLSIHLCHG